MLERERPAVSMQVQVLLGCRASRLRQLRAPRDDATSSSYTTHKPAPRHARDSPRSGFAPTQHFQKKDPHRAASRATMAAAL